MTLSEALNRVLPRRITRHGYRRLPETRQTSLSDWPVITGQLEAAVLADDATGIRRARTDLLQLIRDSVVGPHVVQYTMRTGVAVVDEPRGVRP